MFHKPCWILLGITITIIDKSNPCRNDTLAISGIGLYLKSNVRNFEKNGTKITAEIVSYKKEVSESRNDESTYYYPRFRFKTNDGETVEKTHSSGLSIKPKNPLPERKEIYYLKNENDFEILINSKLWTFVIPNALLIFGMLFLFSTVTILILRDYLHYI